MFLRRDAIGCNKGCWGSSNLYHEILDLSWDVFILKWLTLLKYLVFLKDTSMFKITSIAFVAGIFALSAVPALAENVVPYCERVELKAGQAMVVHGKRGDCGKLPSKSELKPIQFKTGKVQYGKQGVRKSKSCGGYTPVFEAIFVAERPGKEKIELFGDPISITVK